MICGEMWESRAEEELNEYINNTKDVLKAIWKCMYVNCVNELH